MKYTDSLFSLLLLPCLYWRFTIVQDYKYLHKNEYTLIQPLYKTPFPTAYSDSLNLQLLSSLYWHITIVQDCYRYLRKVFTYELRILSLV